jgi:hypothetical protein
MPDPEFYTCAVFERDDVRHPSRFCLRLGNQSYPHMKLLLLKCENNGFAFAVEEHDNLTSTPARGSRDWRFFQQMISHNREVAGRIEEAWQANGLPVAPRVAVGV